MTGSRQGAITTAIASLKLGGIEDVDRISRQLSLSVDAVTASLATTPANGVAVKQLQRLEKALKNVADAIESLNPHVYRTVEEVVMDGDTENPEYKLEVIADLAKLSLERVRDTVNNPKNIRSVFSFPSDKSDYDDRHSWFASQLAVYFFYASGERPTRTGDFLRFIEAVLDTGVKGELGNAGIKTSSSTLAKLGSSGFNEMHPITEKDSTQDAVSAAYDDFLGVRRNKEK